MTTYVGPSALLGGLSLKAAGLIAADTEGSAVHLRHGSYAALITWTACEIDSSNELYVVDLQAKNAAGSWVNVCTLGAFGKGSALGGRADTPASGTMVSAFHNPYGGEVRINTWVTGTLASGFNFSVTVHPIEALSHDN